MKKSALLLEMIFVVVVLSFVGMYFNIHLLELYNTNKNQHKVNIALIELESTRVFISKKLLNGGSISDFTISNNTLFYQNNILLKEVDYFNVNFVGSRYVIQISIYNNLAVKEWVV